MSTATARPRGRAHAGLAPSRFELDGGTLALLESSHDVPLVSIVVALRCGSAGDPPGKSGLSRIAVRMLRRGCEALTSEQIDFRIDALGAEMAVDTSHSNVAIHAQVIARNLDAFVELLSRLLSTPTFPEDELARLKRESVAEIVEARDNDRVVAQKAMQRTLFEGHPYGRSSGRHGAERAGNHRRRREGLLPALRRPQEHRHRPRRGRDGRPGARHRGAPRGRRCPRGSARPTRSPSPRCGPGRRLLVVDKPERTQTQILVGTLGTSPHDDDHVPLVVGNAVFGGTFTSRLMKEIRSKRGWSYGASARTGVDRRRQSWVLWTFPAAEDAGPCLKLSIELLDAWVAGGVTPREVAFIQRYLVRSHAFDIDTATKRLHQALDGECLSLPADYFSGWLDRVRAVTPEGGERGRQEPHPPR